MRTMMSAVTALLIASAVCLAQDIPIEALKDTTVQNCGTLNCGSLVTGGNANYNPAGNGYVMYSVYGWTDGENECIRFDVTSEENAADLDVYIFGPGGILTRRIGQNPVFTHSSTQSMERSYFLLNVTQLVTFPGETKHVTVAYGRYQLGNINCSE